MPDDLKNLLRRLRKSLAGGSEKAYKDRDAAVGGSNAESYAKGESHAYGLAEDEVRKVERENDSPDRG